MRDSPTVRAALKALSQGGAVASPHTQFHLLDPGFLCGQVAAVMKLMNHQNGPVTLHFWDATDILPDYGFVVPRECYKECGKLNV